LTNEVAETHRKKNGAKKDALYYSRSTQPESEEPKEAHVRDVESSFEFLPPLASHFGA
jgi:hypothetical protein